MKQLLQNLRSGETTVEDVPIPTPRPGMVLVRNVASLVSAGTERMLVEFAEKSLAAKASARPDLVRQVLDKARREGLLTTAEAAFNRLDQPLSLGYSSTGIIVEVGDGVSGFKVGQRVACAGGGYAVHAEYVVVPQNLLAHLPENVDFEAGAFATLGAIALHGLRLAELQLGERVVVIGLGLLGLLTVKLAQAAGYQVLCVDLDPRRVTLAKEMGAQAVLRTHAEEAARAFSHGQGCDAVLICADTASNDPVALAGLVARDRANVVAVGKVGFQLEQREYFDKELTFVRSRSYGPGRYDPVYEEGGQDYPIGYVRWTEGRNLQAFVDLLGAGQLEVTSLITHRFPIVRAPEAYGLITGKGDEAFLGVLLTYPAQEATSLEAGKTQRLASRPSTRSSLDRVALGVLGAGNFAGAVLLPAIKKASLVNFIGIASTSGLGAQHLAKKFGFAYATSEAEQLIEDPQINTIAVLTRHDMHAPLTLEALAHGKHVFCEKPLALNRVQLAEIEIALTQENAPLLMVGFNRRFAPLASALHDFLAERREPLVAHYRVNAGYLPPTHWLHDPQQGGGRIIGEGCHFIDLLTYLVGEPPVAVSAQGLPDAGRYQEDNVVLSLHFADGSIGTLSYLANGDRALPKERLEVFTGGRVAILDDFRSLEMTHNGRRRLQRTRWRQDKGHRGEWVAFARAIVGGGPAPIPYEQLFAVARTTFAAVESLRSGKTISINSDQKTNG